MQYRFAVYCPDDPKVIDAIIAAAARFGAGTYGNYSQCAFITHGEGNWKTESGAHPFRGTVGEVTRDPTAEIMMTCEDSAAADVERAIKAVHPWEQVDIEFIPLATIRR